MRSVRIAVAVAGAFTLALALAPQASAAGKLLFRNCVTAETAAGPTPLGTGACLAEGPGFAPNGTATGLDNPESVAVSRDGRSLYAVSRFDDALVRFDRDPDNGALQFAQCFTGDTQVDAAVNDCAGTTFAGSGGDGSGMDGPESVTVAPDGKSVYVTSRFDDAVFAFSRTPEGVIAPFNCYSGESDTNCSHLPKASAEGANSGLDDPKTKEVAISSDGEWLYAVSDFDDSVVRFSRNSANSSLAFQDCFTGEVATGPAGSQACTGVPQLAIDGQYSGIDGPRWIELSRDGRSLYVAAENDDSLVRFARNPNTGALTWGQCVSGDEQTGPLASGACTLVPDAGGGGSQTGMSLPRAIALTDRHLYLVAANDSAIARFKLKRSGRPVFQGCLSADTDLGPQDLGVCALTPFAGEFQQNTGLDGMRDLEVKGRNLYASAQFDSAVTTFNRNPETGKVAFARCVTGETESSVPCAELATAGSFGDNSGLGGVETVAVSRDGRWLYGGVEQDDAIARFKRKR